MLVIKLVISEKAKPVQLWKPLGYWTNIRLCISLWSTMLIIIIRNLNVLGVYNTSGFTIETMYDYYIVMKSMFLVVKLSSQPTIGYVNLTILLPWTTPKQHQNYSKKKTKAFPNIKTSILTTLYSHHNFVQNEGVSQGHKHLLIY